MSFQIALSSSQIRYPNMRSSRFDVVKFIAKGAYSMIYEVVSKNPPDHGKAYAFKRIFLQHPRAVKCALREFSALKKLYEENVQCPFLPTLYYSFRVHKSPCMVITKGSGLELFHILYKYGMFGEDCLRFYLAEVMCGLEKLHEIGIIHMDIKASNILLSNSGHVIIADFDSSFDITSVNRPPSIDDFRGTLIHMSPEVARNEVISEKADIWCLGALASSIVWGDIRKETRSTLQDLENAKKGIWNIGNFYKLSHSLQTFFIACFRLNSIERPSIRELKSYKFFENVNWDVVASLGLTPPVIPSDINFNATQEIFKIEPENRLILEAATGRYMPLFLDEFEIRHEGGRHTLLTVQPCRSEFVNAGMTSEHLEELFTDFDFINPIIYRGPSSSSSDPQLRRLEDYLALHLGGRFRSD